MANYNGNWNGQRGNNRYVMNSGRNQQQVYGPQNNPNRPQYKKSGAKYSLIKDGNFKGGTIVNAWNKSRGKGMITAKVAPYKDSKEYFAKTSEQTYITMIAEINYLNSGNTRLIPCSMNKATKVIALSEIGMVISPNGSGMTSGGKKVTGYFGKFSR